MDGAPFFRPREIFVAPKPLHVLSSYPFHFASGKKVESMSEYCVLPKELRDPNLRGKYVFFFFFLW